MNHKPIVTLEDYDREVLQPAMKRFAECQAYEDIRKENMLKDYGYYTNGKKITKWQRFKYRLRNYRQRAKDIWTILRGGDIHEDCGY